jgi:hypothetical protein
MGLSNFARGSMGQDIAALGSLGALNQQQAQANLRANQLAQQTAAYEPYGRLQQYGQGLTGLAGGVASAYSRSSTSAKSIITSVINSYRIRRSLR